MNSIYDTIPLEYFPLPGLSLENIAGDSYLKIDSAEFGYVEYRASTLERRLKDAQAAMQASLARHKAAHAGLVNSVMAN